jgi:hypothetical protein
VFTILNGRYNYLKLNIIQAILSLTDLIAWHQGPEEYVANRGRSNFPGGPLGLLNLAANEL